MNYNDPYLAYYRHQQLGHGVSSVYHGAAYQRGHGIGSYLGGLFRTISPLLKSGASAVGREALRSGVAFLGDIAGGTVRPRDAAGTRFKEFSTTLKRKADEKMDRVMSGGGAYKKRRIDRISPQSLTRLLSGRSVAAGRKTSKRKTSKRKTVKRKTTKRKTTKRKTTTRKTTTRKTTKRKTTKRTRDIFN